VPAFVGARLESEGMLFSRTKKCNHEETAASFMRQQDTPRKHSLVRHTPSHLECRAATARCAGSWPRPSGPIGQANPVSRSPCSDATNARPSTCARSSTARVATWRTGSRNVSSTSMPIAPRPPPIRANQLRLWLASMAYALLCALRRIGLHDPDFAKATCGTIRIKLLKIEATVRISVRRIRIAMASACPGAQEWARHPACDCRPTPRLAGMTRTAATRNRRGTIPRLTETNSSLLPQPANAPADIASPDATTGCASKNANNPSFKSA
jgi:Transposase DDE domain group 1